MVEKTMRVDEEQANGGAAGESFAVSGNIIDAVAGRIFPGTITVKNGRIGSIEETPGVNYDTWLCPGFVDAHVHVESSLLAPVEFGRAAACHGTVASVSDPHEIANVLGIRGVEWMLENASHTPFKIFFGAPSCVPATPFETAGAQFTATEVDQLLAREDIHYLSEVMNFPAVIGGDPAISAIIDCARKRGKPIDGHAPGVVGDALVTYAKAGIQTDHECSTAREARERIALGMKVAVREGSAARNFEALLPVLLESPESCFFCSDDAHPDVLTAGSTNVSVARAVAAGLDVMAAVRVASIQPISHYRLPVGCLQVNDPADFIELPNLTDFRPSRVWIDGILAAQDGKPLLGSHPCTPENRWAQRVLSAKDFTLTPDSTAAKKVIIAIDGQLLTDQADHTPAANCTSVEADTDSDCLKIAVVNRYHDAPVSVGLIRGFGLHASALASSVAHDSHNVVVVGTSDELMAKAANAVLAAEGGLAAVSGDDAIVLPLPIAGLMGTGDAWQAAKAFNQLTAFAHADGCKLKSPLMTLSFMALLVIPSLKISDKGLFDVGKFQFV